VGIATLKPGECVFAFACVKIDDRDTTNTLGYKCVIATNVHRLSEPGLLRSLTERQGRQMLACILLKDDQAISACGNKQA
jgi:hypothetical protein